MSHLNVSGIANVILATLDAYDLNVGAPPRVRDDKDLEVLFESIKWVLDNPMADEFALLRAWGVDESYEPIPHVAARAGLVRLIALELGGEF